MKKRILLLDIETFPNKSFTWPGMYEVNVAKIVKEWDMASFAYKWLDQKDIICHTRQNQKTDKNLIKKLRSLFNQAHIVIAHNGKAFDIKSANTRILKHKLTPPSPFFVVDTLKVAKKYFKFNSNSLDALAEFLGVGRKLKHRGIEMWDDCMKNKPDAWKEMITYNKHDVRLLESCYLEMLPWIDNHPNLALLDNRPDSCPNCGHDKLHSRGTAYTQGVAYRRYQCQKCGKWSRSRVKNKNKRPPNLK